MPRKALPSAIKKGISKFAKFSKCLITIAIISRIMMLVIIKNHIKCNNILIMIPRLWSFEKHRLMFELIKF